MRAWFETAASCGFSHTEAAEQAETSTVVTRQAAHILVTRQLRIACAARSLAGWDGTRICFSFLLLQLGLELGICHGRLSTGGVDGVSSAGGAGAITTIC